MEKIIGVIESLFKKKISRKGFLKMIAASAALLPFYRFGSSAASGAKAGFNGRKKKSHKCRI